MTAHSNSRCFSHASSSRWIELPGLFSPSFRMESQPHLSGRPGAVAKGRETWSPGRSAPCATRRCRRSRGRRGECFDRDRFEAYGMRVSPREDGAQQRSLKKRARLGPQRSTAKTIHHIGLQMRIRTRLGLSPRSNVEADGLRNLSHECSGRPRSGHLRGAQVLMRPVLTPCQYGFATVGCCQGE